MQQRAYIRLMDIRELAETESNLHICCGPANHRCVASTIGVGKLAASYDADSQMPHASGYVTAEV
jgi:hypothetical protein